MSRTSLSILVLTLVLGAAAGGGLLWFQRDTGGASGDRPPPLVSVTPAEKASVRERLVATGSLVAPESVAITAEAAGRVERVRFTEGARVTAGQVLIELEQTRAEAEVERAAARLTQRDREAERRRELGADDFVSEGELDRAVAAAEEAESALEIARDALEDRTIRAPFDGVTGRRRVSPGALIEPTTVVTRLVKTRTLDLLLDIPGTESGRVQTGMPVEAHTPAYPERTFSGTVRFVGTEVDQATRTLPIEARIDNAEGLLKPGMYLRGELILAERQAVRVPEAAVIAQGPTQLVYVVDDEGRAKRRPVQTGIRRAGWVEIRDGVAAGERVVTKGLGVLRDGIAVRTGPPEGAPAGPPGERAGEGPSPDAPSGAPPGPSPSDAAAGEARPANPGSSDQGGGR